MEKTEKELDFFLSWGNFIIGWRWVVCAALIARLSISLRFRKIY